MDFLLTTYLPVLVHVVIECPPLVKGRFRTSINDVTLIREAKGQGHCHIFFSCITKRIWWICTPSVGCVYEPCDKKGIANEVRFHCNMWLWMPPIRSEKHKKEEDIIWESEPRSEDKRKKKVNWPRHDNWPQGFRSKFSAPNQYICFALHSGIVPNKRETEISSDTSFQLFLIERSRSKQLQF